MTKPLVPVVVLALLACSLASPAAAQNTIEVKYHLPRTVVVVKGTIVTKNVFETVQGAPATKAVSEPSGVTVSLVTGADYAPRTMRLEPSALAKMDAAVTLTRAGTLAGLNRTSEGQLGTVVKNVFGTIVTVAGIVLGGVPMRAATDPAEALYEHDHADFAHLRREMQASILSTIERLGKLSTSLAAEADPVQAKVLSDQVTLLEKSLTRLRREADLLDTHFAAWRSRKEARTERPLEETIDVDSLPIDEPFSDLCAGRKPIDLDAFPEEGAALKHIAEQFQIVLTRVEPKLSPAVPPAGSDSQVLYRRVRPVTLRLYQIDDEKKLVHLRDELAHVVGPLCDLMVLPLPTTKWSKRSLEAQFTGDVLTKLATAQSSVAADATTAIHALSGEYLSALKQVNDIEEQRRALATADIDRQLDEAKKRKALQETRVALNQALNLEEAKSELAALDLQVKTLEAQRAVAALGAANGGEVEALGARQQLLKLQTDLLKAQLEQLRLQQKIGSE